MPVYFARAGTLVKIGISGHVGRRIRTLQTSAPGRLRVLALMNFADELDVEAILHRRFSGRKVHGEWFRLKGEVENFIENSVSLGIAWVPAPEDLEREWDKWPDVIRHANGIEVPSRIEPPAPQLDIQWGRELSLREARRMNQARRTRAGGHHGGRYPRDCRRGEATPEDPCLCSRCVGLAVLRGEELKRRRREAVDALTGMEVRRTAASPEPKRVTKLAAKPGVRYERMDD